MGNAADKANGKPLFVGLNVAPNEIRKVVFNQLLQAFFVLMPADEQGHGSQIAVGKWLTIDPMNDVFVGLFGLFQIQITDKWGQTSLENAIQKTLSKHRTATLIAEDIAQGWSVIHDVLPVINTAIGPRSEYASDAFLVTTDRTGSRQEVAGHLYLTVRQMENICQ